MPGVEMENSTSSFRFSPRPNRAHEIAWRPWGPDAFQQAQDSERPVLLSVSAVWCHWCHVMDETTYSDPAVIQLINENYVPVRIDRDLRPDIDARYNMGGWPTAAFLTPEGDLLSGCTYAPPQEFAALLQQLMEAYRQDKAGISHRAALLQASAKAPTPLEQGPLEQGLDLPLVQQIVETTQAAFDAAHGGFGSAPKFAHADSLALLLHWSRANENAACMAIVHQSLDAMMDSDLRDAEEGGFYRYATGADWSVPHYEKILLDNLKLADLYMEGYLATDDAYYANVAAEVLAYASASLFDVSHGLFFGSQDADEEYYQLPLHERQARAKPPVDATFYTDVNALVCSVHLKAAWVLGRPLFRQTALDALESLLALEWAHGLRHSYGPDGSPGTVAFLPDYAYLLRALLDAYESTESDRYLTEARRVASEMTAQLADEQSGALYDTPHDPRAMAALRRRLVPVDGNALASEALDRLGRDTYDEERHRQAGAALSALTVRTDEHSDTAAAYAMAVYRWLHPAIEVTIGGPKASDAVRSMTMAAAALPYPNVVIKPSLSSDANSEMAWAEACLDTMCLAPVSDPTKLRDVVMAQLGGQHVGNLDDLPVVTLLSPPA